MFFCSLLSLLFILKGRGSVPRCEYQPLSSHTLFELQQLDQTVCDKAKWSGISDYPNGIQSWWTNQLRHFRLVARFSLRHWINIGRSLFFGSAYSELRWTLNVLNLGWRFYSIQSDSEPQDGITSIVLRLHFWGIIGIILVSYWYHQCRCWMMLTCPRHGLEQVGWLRRLWNPECHSTQTSRIFAIWLSADWNEIKWIDCRNL